MWIISRLGFFSISRDPGEDRLKVSGRSMSDMVALREGYLPGASEIEDDQREDCRYSMTAPVDEMSDAMERITSEVDYGDLRCEVASNQGWQRQDVYTVAWKVLRSIGWLMSEGGSRG
jgi:hypothetical protein